MISVSVVEIASVSCFMDVTDKLSCLVDFTEFIVQPVVISITLRRNIIEVVGRLSFLHANVNNK